MFGIRLGRLGAIGGGLREIVEAIRELLTESSETLTTESGETITFED